MKVLNYIVIYVDLFKDSIMKINMLKLMNKLCQKILFWEKTHN